MIERLIGNFYLCVAARAIVRARMSKNGRIGSVICNFYLRVAERKLVRVRESKER